LILAKLLTQIAYQYPKDTIIIMVKLLYRIAEAGTYWWAMYSKYYKEKLLIDTSTYNPCLLITTTNSAFGIISIQTDNTIIFRDKYFSAQEEHKLTQANYTAKPKEKLLVVIPLLFNSYMLSLNGTNINLY
jgi:N-glycosylase/DNA lyase